MGMTGKPERDINWSLTTWKGSRLQQHREFHTLPFARKLEVIEELGEMADQFGGKSGPAGPPLDLREDSKSYGSESPASPALPPKPRKRKE
jgi:hypothetical protein